MKVQTVRPAFFRNVFRAFTEAIQPELKPGYATGLGIGFEKFPEVFAVDGSRLEKVGRLLKVTRSVTKATLPDSMEALYDLRRGCIRDLWFDPDGFASEISMFEQVLPSLPKGSLLLGDRYYPKPVIWRSLSKQGVFMARLRFLRFEENNRRLFFYPGTKCTGPEGGEGQEPGVILVSSRPAAVAESAVRKVHYGIPG